MYIKINLSKLLEERNISQREFSRLTNIRYATINQMCNGSAKMIPLDNLAKICEALDVQISDVLELLEGN